MTHPTSGKKEIRLRLANEIKRLRNKLAKPEKPNSNDPELQFLARNLYDESLSSSSWPNQKDFSAVLELIYQLAPPKMDALGDKGQISTITKRFPSIRLQEFIDVLFQKLTAVPVPPATILWKAIRKHPKGSAQGAKAMNLFQVFMDGSTPVLTLQEWRSFYIDHKSHQGSVLYEMLEHSTPDLNPLDFLEQIYPLLGYALWQSFLSRQANWKRDYHHETRAAKNFFKVYRDPKFLPKIGEVFYDIAESLESQKAVEKRFELEIKRGKNKKRQRKHRTKTQLTQNGAVNSKIETEDNIV